MMEMCVNIPFFHSNFFFLYRVKCFPWVRRRAVIILHIINKNLNNHTFFFPPQAKLNLYKGKTRTNDEKFVGYT